MIKYLKLFPVDTVKVTDSVVEVAKKLRDKQIRHLYVVGENENAVGVISVTDISAKIVAEGKDPKNIVAKDIMNAPVEHVDINQEVEFAMKIMMKYSTYSCLVTDKGKIKGLADYKSVLKKIDKKLRGD